MFTDLDRYRNYTAMLSTFVPEDNSVFYLNALLARAEALTDIYYKDPSYKIDGVSVKELAIEDFQEIIDYPSSQELIDRAKEQIKQIKDLRIPIK